MYRRPKFLEILDEVRQEMSREANYDVDLFAELIRQENGQRSKITRSKLTAFRYKLQEELAPEIKR